LIFQLFWATIYLKAGHTETAHATMLKVLKARYAYFKPAGRETLNTYYLMGIIEQKRGNINEVK
jgi:hypothetical protein